MFLALIDFKQNTSPKSGLLQSTWEDTGHHWIQQPWGLQKIQHQSWVRNPQEWILKIPQTHDNLHFNSSLSQIETFRQPLFINTISKFIFYTTTQLCKWKPCPLYLTCFFIPFEKWLLKSLSLLNEDSFPVPVFLWFFLWAVKRFQAFLPISTWNDGEKSDHELKEKGRPLHSCKRSWYQDVRAHCSTRWQENHFIHHIIFVCAFLSLHCKFRCK